MPQLKSAGTLTVSALPSEHPPVQSLSGVACPFAPTAAVVSGSAVKDVKTPGGTRRLSCSRAERLDMDHVHLSFKQFLWAFFWIAPHALWLSYSGIIGLLLRQRLQRMGWASPKLHEPDRVVAKLLLEGVGMLLHYRGTTGVAGGRELALFVWNHFPMLDKDGMFETAANLTIKVDLTTKRLAEAELDGLQISASDAMTLVWFNIVSASHVKIHASANWGVNVEGMLHPCMEQYSLFTVIYNYFGKVHFMRLAKIWRWLGWIKTSWQQFHAIVDHGLEQGVHNHVGIRELRNHSEVADFVYKVRGHFVTTFAKHKNTFPGIDCEALFVGTILHSLDHTMAEWNLEDPLWLDTSSPRFGLMAELGRFVRVGFVEDLPGLSVRRHFHDSPLPFFQEVYGHAVQIHETLADHLDTCIVK